MRYRAGDRLRHTKFGNNQVAPLRAALDKAQDLMEESK